jgi:pyrroloquinoline-quinone synthase
MQRRENVRERAEDGAVEPQLSADELQHAASFDAAIALCAERYDFRRHPYFLWMHAPSTGRDQFRRSQVPFRFAVEQFPQALGAVLAHISRADLRRPIADNIAEEHGHGNDLQSHKATFAQYLRALGGSHEELERPCPAGVRAFDEALIAFCLANSAEAGAAATGIIEYLYIGISAQIARSVRDRGWCAPGSQRHYEVHEVLDEQHSHDLFEVARTGWPEAHIRAQVARGLLLGAHWFWALYRDLYALR